MRLGKEPRASAIAAKEQGAGRMRHLFTLRLQEQVEIFIGGGAVAHVELHRLADANAVRDGNAAGFLIDHLLAEQQPVGARLLRRAGHAADDREARLFVVALLEKIVRWKRERIAEREEQRTGWVRITEIVRPTEQAGAIGGLFECKMI